MQLECISNHLWSDLSVQIENCFECISGGIYPYLISEIDKYKKAQR